jgi:CheY-like chemotaxis protein
VSENVFLYVEDDYHSRMVMDVLLKRVMAYKHVTIFETSQNFETRFDNLDPQPTVIFLDIHLEPLNGFQMIELIRNRPAHRNTLIVALTASVMNDEIERLKGAGFDSSIAKPIDQDTFPKILSRIFDGESLWYVG